jgi:hypothetical protein
MHPVSYDLAYKAIRMIRVYLQTIDEAGSSDLQTTPKDSG